MGEHQSQIRGFQKRGYRVSLIYPFLSALRHAVALAELVVFGRI